MESRRYEDPSLVAALRGLAADISDLLRKEVRLAKAEAKQAVANGLKAGLFMGAAGVVGFFAVIALLQAAIFGLANLGMGFGWASLIVGLVLAALAAGSFFYGRSLARSAGTPERTLKQVNQDIAAVREQFT